MESEDREDSEENRALKENQAPAAQKVHRYVTLHLATFFLSLMDCFAAEEWVQFKVGLSPNATICIDENDLPLFGSILHVISKTLRGLAGRLAGRLAERLAGRLAGRPQLTSKIV